MVRTKEQEDALQTALEAIDDLKNLLERLEVEVRGDAGYKDVMSRINQMRHELRTLTDVTQRDGRWKFWRSPDIG